MEVPMNHDEARRALALARKALDDGDADKAARLVAKSLRLHDTPQAREFSSRVESAIEQNSDQHRPPPDAHGPTRNEHSHDNKPGTSPEHANSGGEQDQQDGAGRSRLRSLFGKFGGASNADGSKDAGVKRAATKEQLTVVEATIKAETHYEVLGVARTATSAEVKRSYFKLALVLHPDKNPAPEADNAFKILSQAYKTLADDKERAEYDRDLRLGRRPGSRPASAAAQADTPISRRQIPLLILAFLFTLIFFLIDSFIEMPFKPLLYYSKARVAYLRLRGRSPTELWRDSRGRVWLREEDGVVTELTEVVQLAAELEMHWLSSGRRNGHVDPVELFVQAVSNTLLFQESASRGFDFTADDSDDDDISAYRRAPPRPSPAREAGTPRRKAPKPRGRKGF